MTAFDILKPDTGSGRYVVCANSVSVGRAIVGDLSGFIEMTAQFGPGAPPLALDLGVTWALNSNTQLDAGVFLGLTRAADDAVVFTGMVRRF